MPVIIIFSESPSPTTAAESLMGLGYTHEILSPRDAASGAPTGKRQHRPLTL